MCAARHLGNLVTINKTDWLQRCFTRKHASYMLTFLNSFLAWSLLAAAIPILIHLFTRKKLKHIPFSTLQFLRQMQKEKIRQVRLKQWVLLLLRTLIIILLVLAFMQPALRTESPALGKDVRASVVLIIDNSLSMHNSSRGATRLALVREGLRRLASTFTPGDRITVIAAARPARVISKFSFSETNADLDGFLNELSLRDSEADFDGALLLAQQVFATSPNPNHEVYWFSDQKITAPGPVPAGFAANTLFYNIVVPNEKMRNLTLSALRVDAAIFEPGKAVPVRVTVSNSGDFDEKDRLLSVFLNDQRVAQRQISIPRGQQRSELLRVVPREPGYQYVRAVIENDQNNADNERFSLFYIPPESRILLVGPGEESRRFIRLALQAASTTAARKVSEIEPGQLMTTSLDGIDVIVLSNVARFSNAAAAKLDRYVRDGGGLVLFLGEAIDARNYNTTVLKNLAAGELAESIGDIASTAPVLRMGKINQGHPLFASVFDDQQKVRVESPFFRFAMRARLSTEAVTIIQYSNGLPLLAEVSPDRGRALLFFTSADDRWSDIVYKGVFAPLVDRSVRYAAIRGRSPVAELIAGEGLRYRMNSGAAREVSLVLPDERRTMLKPAVEKNAFLVQYDKTGRSGFYRLMSGDEQLYAVAVNFAPGEMTAPVLPADSLAQALYPLRIVTMPLGDELPQRIREQRQGKPLWRFFLALALVMLIAEMLLFRDRTEKSSVDMPVAAT